MSKLDQLNINESGVICQIHGNCTIRKLLMNMGLIPGEQLIVWKKSPFDGPIQIKIAGSNLVLRQNEAQLIYVQKI